MLKLSKHAGVQNGIPSLTACRVQIRLDLRFQSVKAEAAELVIIDVCTGYADNGRRGDRQLTPVIREKSGLYIGRSIMQDDVIAGSALPVGKQVVDVLPVLCIAGLLFEQLDQLLFVAVKAEAAGLVLHSEADIAHLDAPGKDILVLDRMQDGRILRFSACQLDFFDPIIFFQRVPVRFCKCDLKRQILSGILDFVIIHYVPSSSSFSIPDSAMRTLFRSNRL